MQLLAVESVVAARQPITDPFYSFSRGAQIVLTPQDLLVLREALAYWARGTASLVHSDQANPPNAAIPDVESNESQVASLYEKLSPDKVRYIVVDGDTKHAINTRLFRKVPKLQPVSERWQVRTVIG